MIFYVTATPRTGKTLYAMEFVDTKFKGREIYYHGIPGVTLVGWTAIEDPKKWSDLPNGSVVVIDECYSTFPRRKNGAVVPQFIQDMATHGHRGFDFVLITQGSQQVDTFVLALVSVHIHLSRPFGWDRCSVYTSEGAINEKSAVALKSVDKKRWTYPKKYYGSYTSSAVHNVEKRVPRMAIWFAIFAIAVPVLVWLVYDGARNLGGVKLPDIAKLASNAVGGNRSNIQGQQSGQTTYSNGVDTTKSAAFDAASYIAANEGAPWTAPRYDQFTQAVRAPIPRACVSRTAADGRTDCRCWTDQAEKLYDVNSCKAIVNGDFVLDFVALGDAQYMPNTGTTTLSGQKPARSPKNLPFAADTPKIQSASSPAPSEAATPFDFVNRTGHLK